MDNNQNRNYSPESSDLQNKTRNTEYENLDLTTLLELHNSENLKRWIKFIELKDLSGLLEKMALPTFDKIKIKIHTIHIDHHDTSYRFRPFFEALKIRIEKIKNSFNCFEKSISNAAPATVICFTELKLFPLSNKIVLNVVGTPAIVFILFF